MKKLKIAILITLGTVGILAAGQAFRKQYDKTDAAASATLRFEANPAGQVYLLSELLHQKRVITEKLELVNSVVLAEESAAITGSVQAILEKFPADALGAADKEVLTDLKSTMAQMEAADARQLSSYEARDNVRYLSAQALLSVRQLAATQLADTTGGALAGDSETAGSFIGKNLAWGGLVIVLLAFIYAIKKLGPEVSRLPSGRPGVNVNG